jgi:ABC-type phosphate transport system substrate-binding protein
MNGNNNPFRGKQKKPNYSCVTGNGSNNYIPYSEKALKYFVETNDNTEFTTEPMGNYDYMSYLLGDEMDVSGSFESDMMEYEESDDEWYID